MRLKAVTNLRGTRAVIQRSARSRYPQRHMHVLARQYVSGVVGRDGFEPSTSGLKVAF